MGQLESLLTPMDVEVLDNRSSQYDVLIDTDLSQAILDNPTEMSHELAAQQQALKKREYAFIADRDEANAIQRIAGFAETVGGPRDEPKGEEAAEEVPLSESEFEAPEADASAVTTEEVEELGVRGPSDTER